MHSRYDDERYKIVDLIARAQPFYKIEKKQPNKAVAERMRALRAQRKREGNARPKKKAKHFKQSRLPMSLSSSSSSQTSISSSSSASSSSSSSSSKSNEQDAIAGTMRASALDVYADDSAHDILSESDDE